MTLHRYKCGCVGTAGNCVTHHEPVQVPSGVVSHVVATNPEAHRELLDLCIKWHRREANSLYVDWEQSLESYREERK